MGPEVPSAAEADSGLSFDEVGKSDGPDGQKNEREEKSPNHATVITLGRAHFQQKSG